MSDQTKHTPGPWEWSYEDPSVLALYGPRGPLDHVLWSQICPACQECDGQCTGPNTPDARLIAAAPDLLEACKTWIAWMDSPGDGTDKTLGDEEAVLNNMRAAIAKSKGQPCS